MIYGIDLGTTNSLIAYHGKLIGELTASIVDFQTNNVGKSEKTNMEAIRSFKIDMSTTKSGLKSRLASSLVLEKLKSYTGKAQIDAVISVPAYFNSDQRQATKDAAKQAGICVHAVVNEPTVAAIEYAADKRNVFLVFDLGGGTFDVTLVDSRAGYYEVLATDGRILGGDNLDNEILNEVKRKLNLRPHLLNKKDNIILKTMCEEAKIAIQKTKKDYVLKNIPSSLEKEFTLTTEHYKEILHRVFEPAIRLTKQLIDSNKMYLDDYEILLVGGSCHCPYLQEWIRESLDKDVIIEETLLDCIVGLGASTYAEFLEKDKILEKISDVTKAVSLEVMLDDGMVILSELIPKNSTIPTEAMTALSIPEASRYVSCNIYQGDALLPQDAEFIGTMEYDMGRIVEPDDCMLDIKITIEFDGTMTLTVQELMGQPQQVTFKKEA